MTRLYIIRHCEALGNLQKLFQGTTDLDITEAGAAQLRYLGERFRDIPLDAVYASPLIRTQKTAHAVADAKGLPVELHEGVIELDGGIMEGKPAEESFRKYPELADAWLNHPEDFAPAGGEPMRHAYERIWNAVTDIAAKNEGRSVAVASHGGVIRCLVCRMLKGDIKYLREAPYIANTSVTLLEFDGGQPTMPYYNDHSHLSEEYEKQLPEEYLKKVVPLAEICKQVKPQ